MPKNKTLAALDKVMEEQEKAREFLDKQARVIESLDKRIAIQEKHLADLEKSKQAELEKMQDLFDLAITNSHTLPNGYKIKVHGKRPMTVKDPQAFLRWLKVHSNPKDVAEFFAEALKTRSIQKYVERYCDDERLKGNLKPSVDGVDIEAVNFRRLTTSFDKEKRR